MSGTKGLFTMCRSSRSSIHTTTHSLNELHFSLWRPSTASAKSRQTDLPRILYSRTRVKMLAGFRVPGCYAAINLHPSAMSSLVARFEISLFQKVAKRQQQVYGSEQTIPVSFSRYFSDDGPKKRISKVKKKEKKTKSGDTGRSRDLELLLAFLDAPKIQPPQVDKDETIRRELVRKNYNIGRFKQHNEENHDVACKLRMKNHAINMLPKRTALKEKALEIDDNYPPRWRTIPAWTPPIPGFNPSDYVITEE